MGKNQRKHESTYTLLPSDQYLDDLKSELSESTEFLRIVSFMISAEKMMLELLPYIYKVLNNRGKVEIFADCEFSKNNFTDKVWLFLNNNSQKEQNLTIKNKTDEMFKELSNHGAIIKFTKNSWFKKLLPVYKADHRKIVYLRHSSGNSVTYWGGTNIDAGQKNDFMVKTSDNEISESVHTIFSQIESDLPKNDVVKAIDNENFIGLLDTGKPFRSEILKFSRIIIDDATDRIIYVTQLPPEISVLQKLINAEKRGVKIEVILPIASHPNLTGFPYNIAFLLSKTILKLSKSEIHFTHLNKYTHSKILIVDNTALVGSHNLSTMGVISGIKEFSTMISDKNFINQTLSFIDSLKS